jgi:orotate phosphoribosyltransferase-like protein
MRKPIINEEMRARAVHLKHQGVPRHIIAVRLSVSPPTVTKLLRMKPRP